MQASWLLVVAIGVSGVLIRLAPELVFRLVPLPRWLAMSLAWLPVAVAAAMVGLLHVERGHVDPSFLVGLAAAGVTVLIKRSFYGPMISGVIAVALFRHFV